MGTVMTNHGNELIISFIHSNYITKTGGTEKFVIELSEIYRTSRMNHLCFFAFVKQKGTFGKEIVGVNYNDKFIGIYSTKNINNVIEYYIRKYQLKINCFHIQHMMNHNLEVLDDTLVHFPADIVLFVHDFYACCCSEHLINSEGVFCGEDKPCENKCSRCAYWENEKKHFQKIMAFIEKIKKRLISVIVPSNYVARVFGNCFPQVQNRIIVRPHLIPTGEKILTSTDKKIRLAYVGRQKVQKGYDKWKDLIAFITENAKFSYNLYYLGIDNEYIKDVTNVYVSTTAEHPTAMFNAIEEHDITCAFLWPQCAETYSYVYYELISAGVFVITNTYSGNIADEVKLHQNGMIFPSINKCCKWLSNPNDVLKAINDYRSSTRVKTGYIANKDVTGLFSDKPLEVTINKKNFLVKDYVFSLIYRVKYRKSIL